MMIKPHKIIQRLTSTIYELQMYNILLQVYCVLVRHVFFSKTISLSKKILFQKLLQR